MRALVFAALAALTFGGTALAQEAPVPIERDEVWRHWQNVDENDVRAGWRPAATLFEETRSVFEVVLVVGADGRVSDVEITSGPEEDRDAALAAARAMRFSPFERDGRAVAVTFEFAIVLRSRDYYGPEVRKLPENPDLSTLRIRLNRSRCYGTCPAYTVEVHGDGTVIYHGESSVIGLGERRWQISQADVQALLDLIRGNDYFNLRGFYEVGIMHMPAFITSVEIGDQRKFVYNYAGELVGRTPLGPPSAPMPRGVTEVENGIDRLSGAATWVRGDERTLGLLRAEGYDFRSEEAGQALGLLVDDCQVALARAFLDAGAPVLEERRIPISAERCNDAALSAQIARAIR